MITKREWQVDRDGTIHLRNTVDVSGAIRQAKEYDEMGMGNGKNGYMLGVIPEEFYQFDPWLKAAMEYKREGDMANYTTNMIRFFKVHSALAVTHRRAQWGGYSVPIITGSDPVRPKAVDKILEQI